MKICYLYSKIYFSNPFLANNCCVSVIDIFSKVFNEIGIGSDALSIRICDIKCTIALEGGLVVDSFTVDGRGGSGGGAAKKKMLQLQKHSE